MNVGRWTVRLLPAVVAMLALSALATVAASPSPSPAAPACSATLTTGSAADGIQVWLDRPLPAGASPGANVHLGFTLWDPIQRHLVDAQGTQLWWRPPTGDVVAPDRNIATQDWHGHGAADAVVPPQGIGALEIGWTGTSGTKTGGLEPDNTVFRICGFGPPPDAPPQLVATAEIESFAPIVAGQPASLTIVLHPNAEWEPDSFHMPQQLFLRARVPRGATVASVPADLVDAAAGRYRATLTLRDPGAYILEAAASSGASDAFSTSTVTLDVLATAAEPSRPSQSATGPDLLLPALFLIGAVVLLGSLVVLVRREW